MGPRPATAAAAAAAAPVRGVPQYKYAPGVRNPQQHMNPQPQVAMQQVSPGENIHLLGRRIRASRVWKAPKPLLIA